MPVRIWLWLSNFLFMKINRNNQDLKISSDRGQHHCVSCAFELTHNLYWCDLFCRSGRIWMKDIFNSDIFRL